MERINTLNDIISFDSSFRSAVNLYLSLNKSDKVLKYIPTVSSLNILDDYFDSILNDRDHSTLLIGPYGKGKSHLLLVLLAVLSMRRNQENDKIIAKLIKKISSVEKGSSIHCAEHIKSLWERNRYLPVLVSNSTNDLSQAFLVALNDALKRDDLQDLTPETYFSAAIDRIRDWKKNYKDTFGYFSREITKHKMSVNDLIEELKNYSKEALKIFTSIYPKVTAGSVFNPLTVSEILPLYRNVCDVLVSEYGYSGIYIVFDEFSKFIEDQDGHSVGANMKLLQDMCELATETGNSQLCITFVAHKSIKEYGKYLSTEIINSFTGIEGRLTEKYFVTSSKNNYELIKNAIVKKTSEYKTIPQLTKYFSESSLQEFYQLPIFHSSFSKKDFYNLVVDGCFPLNPIAAYLLLNVSEKVAQNERSLFTFISNEEPHSLANFVCEHESSLPWIAGADLIYDYFEPLFRKDVLNEYIHNIWLSSEYALSKCISENQKRVVKALAIFHIVNKEEELPAVEQFLSLCTDIDDFSQIINELTSKQLIYCKSSTGVYTFKTRAGSELKTEIKRRRVLKGENVNYSKALVGVTGKYFIVPRKYNSIHCMTRFFSNEYMSSEDFLNINDSSVLTSDKEADGKVITIYSFSKIKPEEIRRHLRDLSDEKLVVVCPKQEIKLQKQLRDYEIVQELKDNKVFNDNNEILRSELPLLIEDLTIEIESIIDATYSSENGTVILRYDGQRVISEDSEESAVNECCEKVYSKTPYINNEMVNRMHITSSQTRKSRTSIIEHILNGQCDEDFYSGSNQEATIYRSVFVCTNLKDGNASEELKEIIGIIDRFIDECCDTRRCVSELIDILISAPFGLRLGVIPMLMSYVISERHEDIIVYCSGREIQLDADVIVNMCELSSEYSLFVSKADLQKEKYIKSLNELFGVNDSRNLTSNRIKDIIICMQRWFRSLAQTSRNTVNLEDYIADEKIRNAMIYIKKSLQSVELNPFELLFVSFPNEFGEDDLSYTYQIVELCKTKFDNYFDWLQNETAKAIYRIWGERKSKGLNRILRDWYDIQSERSKMGLYSGRVTNFMSCISALNTFDDSAIAMKIAKAVTNVHIENWVVGSLEGFVSDLTDLKKEIEGIKDESSSGEFKLTFSGKNGEVISKLYNYANEGTGSILKNIIEDALEQYDDLSVNDRVSILLEMIEKIIK